MQENTDNQLDEKTKKIKQLVISTILFIAVTIITKLVKMPIVVKFILYLVPYFCAGYDVIREAFENIRKGEIFDENFLMTIATFGAMVIGFLPNSKEEFTEACFVMIFYQLGEFFEILAENNSKKSISSLMKIRPDYANLIKDNKIKKVDPKDVKIDDIIVINPGEKVPLDGIIIKGTTNFNTVAITGESLPRKAIAGDEAISGYININGQIEIKVTKLFKDSTVSKIIDLVENANENKSKSDKFITKFSKIYTPIVVLAALIIAIIPSIITKEYVKWISRALTFLVVSCPCALVISVPLTYFGGIGGAAKKGILIKGANYLELLSKLKVLVFDKTGTLTKGVFEVVAIHPNILDENKILHLAAHAENFSTHPIANSLKNAYKKLNGNIDDDCKIEDVEEIAGMGMKAKVNNEYIYVGNSKLMDQIKIKYSKCNKKGTIIHVASNKEYLGHIIISDVIKEDSKNTIDMLHKLNIKTIMLTGDKREIAKDISNELNIDEYHAELLPQDKVTKLEEILKKSNGLVAFVGDGINDAPVIARADIGISMGKISSDAAIESSDIVLMDDKLSKIIKAIEISKKTQKIANENIIFALVIKILVLILAFFGLAPMYLAVFADVGVTILDILNAMRTLKIK